MEFKRSEIANAMKNQYIEENITRSDILGGIAGGVNKNDRVRNWTEEVDAWEDPNAAPTVTPDDAISDGESENDSNGDFDEANQDTNLLPELSAYTNVITKLPAYQWLLESIQRELYMNVPGNMQSSIKDSIIGYLPRTEKVSRRTMPRKHTMIFTADWDPHAFLQEQGYSVAAETAIERAITITGSETDAQAATTMQYLSQTWPSSGVHLLHLVKRVIQGDYDTTYSYK